MYINIPNPPCAPLNRSQIQKIHISARDCSLQPDVSDGVFLRQHRKDCQKSVGIDGYGGATLAKRKQGFNRMRRDRIALSSHDPYWFRGRGRYFVPQSALFRIELNTCRSTISRLVRGRVRPRGRRSGARPLASIRADS